MSGFFHWIAAHLDYGVALAMFATVSAAVFSLIELTIRIKIEKKHIEEQTKRLKNIELTILSKSQPNPFDALNWGKVAIVQRQDAIEKFQENLKTLEPIGPLQVGVARAGESGAFASSEVNAEHYDEALKPAGQLSWGISARKKIMEKLLGATNATLSGTAR